MTKNVKQANCSVKFVPAPKPNGFSTVYVLNAIAYYASVFKTKAKFESNEREYSLTLFVDAATKNELDETLMLNKQFFEIGVGKNKKRKVKFEKEVYDTVPDGWFGFTVSAPQFFKSGKPVVIEVLDVNNQRLPENIAIGNGSVVSVKLASYANKEGLLNTRLELVKVTDLVEYELQAGGGSIIEDDVLGISGVQRTIAPAANNVVEKDIDPLDLSEYN